MLSFVPIWAGHFLQRLMAQRETSAQGRFYARFAGPNRLFFDVGANPEYTPELIEHHLAMAARRVSGSDAPRAKA